MEWSFRTVDGDLSVLVRDEGNGVMHLLSAEDSARVLTGRVDYDWDHHGRRALHAIVVSEEGAGLGSIMMWCFAVAASTEADGVIALHGPGDDVMDWYRKLGFIADPDYLMPIVAEIGESFDEATARRGARAVPMIGHAPGVAHEATRSWSRTWELFAAR